MCHCVSLRCESEVLAHPKSGGIYVEGSRGEEGLYVNRHLLILLAYIWGIPYNMRHWNIHSSNGFFVPLFIFFLILTMRRKKTGVYISGKGKEDVGA